MVRSRVRWLLMAGHVSPDLRGGGIARYTIELARALSRREDVDLHVLGTAEAADPLGELIGDRTRVLESPAVPDAMTPAFERYALGRRLGASFDVVQGVKHLVPRNVRARTVLTVHDMLLFDRGQDYPTVKRYLLRQPYAASIQQADHLICVSAATRDRVRAWYPDVRGRIGVVLSATGSLLTQAHSTPVEDLRGRSFALVVGDPSPRKNLATVISAWAHVVLERPDALLVLVGPPAWGARSYGPDHRALVASGHVRQLVGVDDGVLKWLYQQATVVLAPSLSEGFGLPAVEALDLGAPLVTSDDPALVEVSGDAAVHLPALDVAAWARETVTRLAAGRGASMHDRSARTWDDVAEETVAAVLRRTINGS